VRNVAISTAKTATFMPQAAVCRQRRAACNPHQSLWKDGNALFAGDGYAASASWPLWYIGGLLKHARALIGDHRSTNQQLQAPGAGLRSAGSTSPTPAATVSAACRIPMYSSSRRPSASSSARPNSCNPYLFVRLDLMAGASTHPEQIDPANRSTRTFTICRRKR